jgi:hypothetical protein
MRFKAGVDAAGKLTTWTRAFPAPSFAVLRNASIEKGVAGIDDILYDIPNIQVEYKEPD